MASLREALGFEGLWECHRLTVLALSRGQLAPPQPSPVRLPAYECCAMLDAWRTAFRIDSDHASGNFWDLRL
ncbi:hypothetical protein GMOD_00008532 [Pyrenophora seminiperda CCB06]|uniref:Uncharacterized protein n=1 Tax=Pyrenophora seminiperda CCB06 TaxID=1302712 RepID=A0A3M7M8R0_9PLEO|nr:hypothetical protein GMOD_00008532 [Pyrenophora seminiperda CCB06]